MTRVAEVMTRNATTLAPNETVREAARMMDEMNVGALPVCDGKRLIGMVTDRDIAVRAVSAGMDLDSPVDRIASKPIAWCFENDDVEAVQHKMADQQIRRVPVVDDKKQLVGIISLGDLATHQDGNMSSTLGSISSPSEPDR
ncbi:CBS domain-containing protein [Trinickia symbiotica]|uniref:CBS domain-containing protein n=1 Tax=Trinickia symbiotica TaxID=863227 RepID=A0A2T3Y127_9BURK|nr:CBS domain-containing protein [Trinickia symbiotica]PTB22473.1 CBS domain-containing protein [Trinickia symbiotica]